MNKLMEQVEEYKRLEDDQLQDKAKAKALAVEKKDVKANQDPRSWRDFFSQAQKPRSEIVSSLYKEHMYRSVEKIKNESYFC